MAKKLISSVEINQLIRKNLYPVHENNWFLSRCIDGRHLNNSKLKTQRSKPFKSLEPLARPGADVGDLMAVFSANFQYQYGLEKEEIFQAFLKTISGWSNFRFHSDNHFFNLKFQSSTLNLPLSSFFGCGHFREAAKSPSDYNLVREDIEAIFDFLKEGLKNKIQPEILFGDHCESGVLIIKTDNFSVYPQMVLGEEFFMIFVYQKALDDKRRRLLVKNLMPFVKNSFSLDEDYIYQSLSQVVDDHFLETINRLGPDLPVYEVVFFNENEFEVKRW